MARAPLRARRTRRPCCLGCRARCRCAALFDTIQIHDSVSPYKTVIPAFLKRAKPTVELLRTLHRRVLSRFARLLLYYGVPPQKARSVAAQDFFSVIGDFAFEYKARDYMRVPARAMAAR